MARPAGSLLLLLLLLSSGAVSQPLVPDAPPADLPQQLQANSSSNSSASSSELEIAPTIPNAMVPPGGKTQQRQVLAGISTPPWLLSAGRKSRPAADDRRVRRQPRPAAGAPRQQTPTGAAATARPRRFVVQLKTPSAAAVVGPSLQPVAATTTAAAADLAADSEATSTVRTSRITPQAAAAAAAVLQQAEAVAAAAGVSGAQVSHRYSYALSGFAVQDLTAAQLAALAADPQVLSIVEDRLVTLATYTTHQFLGLTGTGIRQSSATTFTPQHHGSSGGGSGGQSSSWGLWDQLGGVLGRSGAGENVVVGVIDTGIWMEEQSSFVDKNYWSAGPSSTTKRQHYHELDDFKGTCSVKEGSPECNNKMLGCRYYTAGWGGDEALKALLPDEVLSCKDVDGHGSHTAGTAAGNYGSSSVLVPTKDLMSGMAPRARLAVYKALWAEGGGYEADVVAAIEDCIKDGVDVINYSVSGDTFTFRGPTNTAFMNAARAGVFAAVAAGNEGPDATVQNISPWCTTVAASTHDRTMEAALTLGDGTRLAGSGIQPAPVGPLPLVLAGDLAADPTDTTNAVLCAPDSLDPSKLSGPAIIVCDRGTYLLVEKGQEVQRVGGKAMVVLNVPGGRTDLSWASMGIPFIQLLVQYRETVVNYAEKTGATATVGATTAKRGTTAPAMADFSSRGPTQIAGGVVMKPDITAPGVTVLAPFTDVNDGNYYYLDGTSMATPHIAGIAALLKEKFPTSFSPMMIKSAIMTSAYQTTRTGTKGQSFGTALDYGAGHVDPPAALNPGLVFDSSYKDWQQFLCDVEPLDGDDCATLCAATTKQSFVDSSVLEQPPAAEEAALEEQEPGAAAAAAAAAAEPAASVVEEQGAQVEAQHKKPPPSPPPGGAKGSPCNAFNLNTPWVSGEVAGSLTVRRTLTSVLSSRDGKVTFTAAASVDAGSAFSVKVSPTSFKLGAWKGSKRSQQTVTITIKATAGTPLSKYQFGQVVWTSTKGHRVRIPLALTFSTFIAPGAVVPTQRRPSFNYQYKVTADVATAVSVKNGGFSAAVVTPVQVSVTDDLDAPGVGKLTLTVPEGNTYLAIITFKGDMEEGANIDLILTQGDQVSVADSDGASEFLYAGEGLLAGVYTLYVRAKRLPSGGSATVYVHTWMFPAAAGAGGSSAGVMQVSPSSVPVRPGDRSCCPVTLSFSGLDFASTPPKRYIGLVENSRADGVAVTVPRTEVYLLPGF